MNDYESLLDYCSTDRQIEIIKTLIKTNSQRQTARKLKLKSHGTVSTLIVRLRQKKLKDEAQNHIQEDMTLNAESLYQKLDEDTGQWKTTNRWLKANKEKDNLFKKALAAVERANKYIKPQQPIEKPMLCDQDMFTFYPLPDLHFGLLIHGDETTHGYNFDLKKSREWITAGMRHLVSSSPKTKTAVISDLGDFLHAQDDSNRTKSGHELQVDGRHYNIVDVAYDTIKDLINMALEKHEEVIFYSIPGNHSDLAPVYLKSHLKAWYRDEPRVTITEYQAHRQYYKNGKNLLGFAHGHELKPNKAGEVMLRDNMKIVSETEFREMNFGHFHSNHKETTEMGLVTVNIRKNPIPADVWNDAMGYGNGILGFATCEHWHKDYGKMGTNNFNIMMLS